MKNFKKLLAILCTLAIMLTSLSVGTVFAASTEDTASVDYSSITFDTENGTTGNLSSSAWKWYKDGATTAIGGNNTKMLMFKPGEISKETQFGTYLYNDTDKVVLTNGKAYRLDFEYYADAYTAGTFSGTINFKDVNGKINLGAATLAITQENGTNGVWKKARVYFVAETESETENYLRPYITVSTTTDAVIYFDNFSLVELESEKENDYSNITFDTANGNGGNTDLANTKEYWSYYDACDGIDGNYSRMLRLHTSKASSQLNAKLLNGENQVTITEGKTYRLDFQLYADAGVDIKQFVIRNSSNGGIQTSWTNQWGAHTAANLGVDATGTNGKWKNFRAYITATATTTLTLSFTLNTATAGKYMYFDNFSLVELPAEKTDDYSEITFDTANVDTTTNADGSTYIDVYEDYKNGVAGNYTRMLRYYAKGTDNAQFNVNYGATNVALIAGERYRVDFDIYAEDGIDIKKATFRDQSVCLKDNVLLPVTSAGTNGKWVRFTAFFTAGTDSTSFKMSIQSNTATNKYLYIDNISLTPFNPESAITFEGKTNGAAVDTSTTKWTYTTDGIAGNDTTKLVFSHTGQASGSVYNDFGDALAIEKGYYYIVEFDYYMGAYGGTLGAIYNNDIGYKCNLDVTPEKGTDGVWKTSTSIFKATGETDKFKFSFNPTNNPSNIAVYIDNVAIVQLYECSVEAPEILSTNPANITLNAVEGYEYSVDGVHFQKSGVFNKLHSETGIYPVYCREALTDNGYPSAPSEPIYIQLPYAGDVNSDKALNADDLVQMRGRLLGNTTEIADPYFDANKDDAVSLKDLVNLKKQIANKVEITTETTVVRDSKTYTLAWNDDFTGSYIDRNNWADRSSNASSELQIFENDADNLFINNDVEGNSCLVLQAVKETDAEGNITYTSGGVDTYGKFDFKTGYVEIRAKLPAGAGVWPGFWFGGTSNRDGATNWPENGEIDVFEFYGYKPDTVYHNFHYATYDEEGNAVANKIRNQEGEYCTTIDGNFSDEFHTFGCEWTEEYVAYYVDGVLSCKYEKDATIFEEINNEDMYLLVTLAIGGSDEAIADIANTEFPAQMAIDYVRYYN